MLVLESVWDKIPKMIIQTGHLKIQTVQSSLLIWKITQGLKTSADDAIVEKSMQRGPASSKIHRFR